ncbi:MAG: hypothetical protein IPH48_16490 [bacterium]|nr:hypothetical protein [bacterium]
MNRSEFLDRITNVTQWSRKGERAPHKPLLLLLVLARCARGEGREVAYREIDQPLFDLLREFGPSRKSTHPEYPFWHLQSDGIWVVRDAELLERQSRSTCSRVNRTYSDSGTSCSNSHLTVIGRSPSQDTNCSVPQ